jgi:threonine/homoserine/homoserine lactone efflux protein
VASELGYIFAAAIAVAISPVPIVAAILICLGQRARRNGSFFLLGWVLGLLTVIGLVLLLPDDIELKRRDWLVTAGAVVKLMSGSFFVVAGFVVWMHRPKEGEERPLPIWASRLESATAIQALLLAIALAVINPKNLALALMLVFTLLEAGLPPWEDRMAVVFFVVVGSLTIAAPVSYRLIAGEQANRRLQEWKDWLLHNNATIIFVLFLVVGVTLFGQGLGQLL